MTDKPALNLVQLRDGRPPLSDITGRLRLLADQIDAGEHGNVYSVLILLPRPDGYPVVLQYGSADGENNPIIQTTLAQALFVGNIARRG